LASKKKPNSNQASPVIAAPPPSVPIAGGFGRDLCNWLFPAFLAMVLLGFFCIWKYGSAAGNPNPVRSLFIAMNSATLSGFDVSPGVGGLNDFGQWTALILIVGGSLFSMIVGGLAVIRIVRMPFTDGGLILAAFLVEAAALLVGTSLLWDPNRSPFQALFLAASSFGNCGLYVADLPKASELPVHAIVLPLTILGGLGLPVLMELWCAIVFRAKLSAHSKSVIVASAWIYVIGLMSILALNQAGHGGFTWDGLKSQLPTSSVLTIESRTGGMGIVGISDLTQPARWFLIVLMLIGANSAGTGGGVKPTTFIELFRGIQKLLHGQSPGRSFAIAVVWLAVYLGLALAAVLLLAYVSGIEPADNTLFDAISALSNVGFTVSPVMDQKGLFFAYSAIILVGRMAPLMVLWWMADTTNDAELAVG
jgi:Trk-type K+ transport system membrane component